MSAEERCNMTADYGLCHGSQLRWHFDSQTQLCQSFLYSGCGGNANRFESHEACAAVCREAPRTTPLPDAEHYAPTTPKHSKGVFNRNQIHVSLGSRTLTRQNVPLPLLVDFETLVYLVVAPPNNTLTHHALSLTNTQHSMLI